MKYKDSIIDIVCTFSRVKKFPISYVGKSKQPKCFRNADDD